MHLPGFTADASLTRHENDYHTSSNETVGDNLIVPQLPMVYGIRGRDFLVGEGFVYDLGGGGFIGGNPPFGGGVNPNIGAPGRCRPRCGPCIDHTKTCVTVNCDSDERAC